LDDLEIDVLHKTSKKFAIEWRDRFSYGDSVMSVYKIFKSIGFEYGENNNGSKFIVERGDIVSA
jgi:hypothetical protein